MSAFDTARNIRMAGVVIESAYLDTALLSPSQSYFLRENLKLRLLAARMALVRG